MKSSFSRLHYIYIGLAALSFSLAITTHVFAESHKTIEKQNEVTEETKNKEVKNDSERDADTDREEKDTNKEAQEHDKKNDVDEDEHEVDDDDSKVRDQKEKDEKKEEEEKAEKDDRKEEKRETLTEKFEERRGILQKHIQNRLINLARNMNGRMEAAIDRMEQIISRLESRIEKLADEGVDTITATENLDEAKGSLHEAETILGGIYSDIIRVVTADSPRESFAELKRQFLSARDLIIETHALLRSVVQELKNPTVQSDQDKATDETGTENGSADENRTIDVN